jgi:hypothetical protein
MSIDSNSPSVRSSGKLPYSAPKFSDLGALKKVTLAVGNNMGAADGGVMAMSKTA